MPEAILASRTILIPLVRSADPKKANAEVADYSHWPHDRRKLIDDLWSLALANLAKLPAFDVTVNGKARLTGRNLEPWKAILSVALWLEDQGLVGIWERMEGLALDYQRERHEMEKPDLTTLVIMALCQCAIVANSANSSNRFKKYVISTAEVCITVLQIADDLEADIDENEISDKRIGHVLKKLRLQKETRSGGKGGRKWSFTSNDLERWKTTFSIQSPDDLSQNGSIGSIGSIGTVQEEVVETFDLRKAA